jgi:hypothetical protein
MNAFVLFMMIFTSPPASKAHPVWTLHSTAHIEFATMQGCIDYGTHLQNQLDTTDTMTMRGWCVSQSTGVSTFSVPNPHTGQAEQSEAAFVEIPSKRARQR